MKAFGWGWRILLWGLIGAALSVAPALLFAVLPPAFSEGFTGLVAALLTLTVMPLALLIASAGAILLLVGWLWRERG